MSASADTPPTDIQHNEAPQYQVLGTGDGNDGRFAQGIVLIDPATGQPYAAAGGSGTGAVSIADGADVAQGATTDASTASTLVGLLKNIKAALAGILAVKIDQTTPGTTNAVAVTTLPALAAGANTIGSAKLTDGTHSATVSSGGALLTDGSATTQPVSGTLSLSSLPAPAAASAAALASVAGSTSSVTLLAANSARVGALVTNDSGAALYLAYAATATTSAYTVKLAAGGYWEMPLPLYKGLLSGIWDAATGAARLTELS